MARSTTEAAASTDPAGRRTSLHRHRPASDATRRDRTFAAGAVLVALLPFVVAITANAGRDYVPLGDVALTDLRVRDVWSADIPLVGAYSRFGWNHPGPASFWSLAPISGMFGRDAWATLVAGAVVHALTVVAIAWVAWRAGRLALVLAALAFTALAYGAMGPSMVLDAWNPNFAYPLFMLFVLLAWSFARGDRVLLVPLAIVGGVLVQAHVGYLPLVFVAGGIALALGVRRDRAHLAAWRWPAWFAFLALLLVWAPPIVHELVHPSNVRPLAESLVDPEEGTLGFGTAAGIVAEEFEIPPPWLGGEHRLEPFANLVVGASRWWSAVPVVLLATAWAAARRRRAAGSVELLLIATALAAVGLVAIARVVGDPERYVFYWRVPIALLVVFASGWSIWNGVRLDDAPLARRLALAGFAGVIAFASVAGSVRIAQVEDVNEGQALAIDALEAIGNPRGIVLVREAGIPFMGLQRAVVNELDRAGADVRVDDDLGFQFGYSRAATVGEVDEVWYVAESGQYTSLLTGASGARVVWANDPLPRAEETELREGQRVLWEALRAAGRPELLRQLTSPLVAFALADVDGVDAVLARRVAELNERAERAGPCRCAIVAFPADADPGFAFE